MATIPIPQEMLPRMDWNAEDKSAAWEHFTTRMKLYYTVANTKEEAKVDTILFFGGTEATDRWTTLKEQLSAENYKSSDKVFTAFAKLWKELITLAVCSWQLHGNLGDRAVERVMQIAETATAPDQSRWSRPTAESPFPSIQHAWWGGKQAYSCRRYDKPVHSPDRHNQSPGSPGKQTHHCVWTRMLIIVKLHQLPTVKLRTQWRNRNHSDQSWWSPSSNEPTHQQLTDTTATNHDDRQVPTNQHTSGWHLFFPGNS